MAFSPSARSATTLPAPPRGQVMSDSKGWWRLVWCHERCHKPENVGRRQAIGKAATNIGAGLVYLKKAKQFSAWIERVARPDYILVTDWREAQPCVQAVKEHNGNNLPFLTVVICDSAKQMARATEWANGLPEDGCDVHVCERSNIPQDWTAGVLRKYFGNGGDNIKMDPTLPQPRDDCEEISECSTQYEETSSQSGDSDCSQEVAMSKNMCIPNRFTNHVGMMPEFNGNMNSFSINEPAYMNMVEQTIRPPPGLEHMRASEFQIDGKLREKLLTHHRIVGNEFYSF